MFELQGGVGDNVVDLSPDMSVVSGLSDGARPLTTDVRAGLSRVIQVFITHSANVFMVEYPPVVHATGREVTGLDDLVCLSAVMLHILSVLCYVTPSPSPI